MTKNPHEAPNPSIACSVDSCTYHCGKSSHCTLNEIKVDSTETHPRHIDGTICASFEAK